MRPKAHCVKYLLKYVVKLSSCYDIIRTTSKKINRVYIQRVMVNYVKYKIENANK